MIYLWKSPSREVSALIRQLLLAKGFVLKSIDINVDPDRHYIRFGKWSNYNIGHIEFNAEYAMKYYGKAQIITTEELLIHIADGTLFSDPYVKLEIAGEKVTIDNKDVLTVGCRKIPFETVKQVYEAMCKLRE